jgi:hypothetical protein
MPRSFANGTTMRLCRIRYCCACAGVVGLLLLLMLSQAGVQAQSSNYDNYGYNDNDYSDPNQQRGAQPPPDSLYHDYAVRQQEKEIGAVGGYVQPQVP